MTTNQEGKRPAASRPIHGPDGSSLVNAPAATGLAWALTALSALLVVLAVMLLALNRDLGVRTLTPHLVLVPGFAVVGLVLAVLDPAIPSAGCSSPWAWSPPSTASPSSLRCGPW